MNGYMIYLFGFIVSTCITYTLFYRENHSSDFGVFSFSILCSILWFIFIPLLLLWCLCRGFKTLVRNRILSNRLKIGGINMSISAIVAIVAIVAVSILAIIVFANILLSIL